MPGENSYSHHTDMDVGVAIIDRFTFFALEFFETVQRGSNATMADFLAFMGCAAFMCHRDAVPPPESQNHGHYSGPGNHGVPASCFKAATPCLWSCV